jgi:thiol-disulfide isomerase/thioredoxin
MNIFFVLPLLLSSFQEVRLLPKLPASFLALYGTQAPDVHMWSIDGTEYGLTSLRGRYVLLDFWAVACGPCRDSMPALEAIHRDYRDQGLVILGIDVGEERPTVEIFLNKTPASYPIVLDTSSDVAKLFHVLVVPTFMLIDPDGKIVDGQVGFLKAAPDSQENIGEFQLRGMLRRITESDLRK